MSRGDLSFMRPVRVRSRAVLGRYFFRSDHSTRLVVKEEVLVPGLCGTLVKPMTSLLGVWVVVGIGATNSAGNSTGRRFSTARKPCNSNAVTSWFERVATELHAKLVVDPAMRDARPGRASRRRAGYHQSTRPHWCGGRRRGRRAWLRCPWAVAGPGRASRRRAERSSRRGRLAGGPPPTGAQSSPA